MAGQNDPFHLADVNLGSSKFKIPKCMTIFVVSFQGKAVSLAGMYVRVK